MHGTAQPMKPIDTFASNLFSSEKEMTEAVSDSSFDDPGAFFEGWNSGSSDDLGMLFNDAEMSSMTSSSSEENETCNLDLNISTVSLTAAHLLDCKSPTKLFDTLKLPEEDTRNSKRVKTEEEIVVPKKEFSKEPVSTAPHTTSSTATSPPVVMGLSALADKDCKMELEQDSGTCSPDSAASSDNESNAQKLKRVAADAKRQTQSHRSGSFFDILTLEERQMMEQEGVTIPQEGPLTKMHERELKRLRRQIKNKYSAKDSRRKRKEYMENLESVNNRLRLQMSDLNSDNGSLRKQLRHIKRLIQPKKIKGAGPSSLIMLCLLLSRNGNKQITTPMDTDVDAGLSTSSRPTSTECPTMDTAEESDIAALCKMTPSVFSMVDPKQLFLRAASEAGMESLFPPDTNVMVEGAATFEPSMHDSSEFPWTPSNIQQRSDSKRSAPTLDQVLG